MSAIDTVKAASSMASVVAATPSSSVNGVSATITMAARPTRGDHQRRPIANVASAAIAMPIGDHIRTASSLLPSTPSESVINQ